MTSDYFSRKYKLRPTPDGLIYQDVPKSARIGLFHIITEYEEIEMGIQGMFFVIYREVCKVLRKPWNWHVTEDYLAAQELESLLINCEWWEYYDICQHFWEYLDETRTSQSERKEIPLYENQINDLFKDEFLGFELKDGKIERVGSPITDAQIREARYILKEPEFKGADTQFEKAIKAINIRPNTDVENCIKDAVGAIESVGRIITNNDNALLDDIIKNAVKKGVIPKPLDQTFIKLYAYRGNEPGVAHGAVGESKITVDEAELILAMSAAMIIYLVKKRSLL